MVKKSFFGTDGIRGKANSGNITAEKMLQLGMAAGIKFTRGDHKHRVIIGKDTRLSGYMIENALTSGFLSVGMDVILTGPVPTPAVAMLTKSMRADIGVMISASHNPFEDNGVKFFDPEGFKLPDETELEIEKVMQGNMDKYLVSGNKIGRATRMDDVASRYIEFVKSTFPKGKKLEGLKIVVDCANGSAYKIAPTILWELGAEVISIGTSPNGLNINLNCGSTHPQELQKMVIKEKADIGIALDGDADRIIVVDENGDVIDGDLIIATIASYWSKEKKLKGDTIVTTKMSNLGMENYLKTINIGMKRTEVGDRYVAEYMRKHDLNIGGEQSGHIIISDYSTTGDALIAAMQILAVLVENKQTVHNTFNVFKPMPQILKNVKLEHDINILSTEIQEQINAYQDVLGNNGRIFVRKSGTEALVRIMVEGEDELLINNIANEMAEFLKNIKVAIIETPKEDIIHENVAYKETIAVHQERSRFSLANLLKWIK